MNAPVKFLALLCLGGVVPTSPLVTHVSIGAASIVLEESTFATAAKQLGTASLVRFGDGGDGRVQACYQVPGAAGATYYLDSGEMGGGERIMEVEVVGRGQSTAAASPVIATNCAVLAADTGTAMTETGLRLGLSRAEAERLLQILGSERDGVALYERTEKSVEGARVVDVSSRIRIRYVRGRVAAFSAELLSTT